jgi:adenylosuccinate synthase
MKMVNIRTAYQFPKKQEDGEYMDVDCSRFIRACQKISQSKHFKMINFMEDWFNGRYTNVIWEGSQGLMLDSEIGLYPNCTPSKLDLPGDIEFEKVYLVTRGYHTRHGNGFFPSVKFPVRENKWETNPINPYQGTFRTGILDIGLLRYAVKSSNISRAEEVNLVISHMDIIKDDWRIWNNEQVKKFGSKEDFITYIVDSFPKDTFKHIYLNDSPFVGNLYYFK